jgi:spore maturation protein CgeB
MAMLKILFIGNSSTSSTSSHRANAIKRLGHDVRIEDPFKAFAKVLDSRLLGALHFRTGYRFLQPGMTNWIQRLIHTLTDKPDLLWVDSGELLGPRCLEILQKLGCPLVLYNLDDPTGNRDGRRFDSLIKSLPYYDLVAVVRKESERECRALGAKRVMLVYRSYDEIEHKPFDSISDIPKSFRSDVAFIGTWMRHEKRDEFLWELISSGIPVSIWGSRWENSRMFSKLKAHLRGGSLSGRDYVAAIQGSKICIGLLSKGNRDLHTQRSLEVPFAGGLFCAERTVEHQEMYKEGEEAVFWSDANECIKVCKQLLANDTLRENIRVAGMRRIKALKTGNEDVFKRIIDAALIGNSALSVPAQAVES